MRKIIYHEKHKLVTVEEPNEPPRVVFRKGTRLARYPAMFYETRNKATQTKPEQRHTRCVIL